MITPGLVTRNALGVRRTAVTRSAGENHSHDDRVMISGWLPVTVTVTRTMCLRVSAR
jgi:hypothetical protein